jgi:RsiW-degrading membrane proteinase PrsW (M82 family)
MLLVVYFSDKEREPPRVVFGTYALGALLAIAVLALEQRAARWTGLGELEGRASEAGALIFLFALVAPVREAAKVAATWPAFRSRHFDEPYDGLVYSASSALGFATVEVAWILREHTVSGLWLLRALLSLPANVFFACAWGYALGRAKQKSDPGAVFPLTWLLATGLHGGYLYLLFGRRDATVLIALPVVVTMMVVVFFVARDLRRRPGAPSHEGAERMSRMSLLQTSAVPSFQAVRAALRRSEEPLRARWILFGAFVTLGAMLGGLGAAVGVGHWARVDFSVVNERDVSTAGPVALIGSGLLAAFPLSGYLLAKAARVQSLLEPALATALAIFMTLLALGFTAPVGLLLGLSCAPIAWGLACVGAWVGRVPRARLLAERISVPRAVSRSSQARGE